MIKLVLGDIREFFREAPSKLRIMWIVYAISILLPQFVWFLFAYFASYSPDGSGGVLGFKYSVVASITDITAFVVLVVINIVCVVLLYWLSVRTRVRYPSDNWKFTHGNNTYTLTFDEDKVEYEKIVEVIPLEDNLTIIRDGTYSWSGKAEVEPDVISLDGTTPEKIKEIKLDPDNDRFMNRVYYLNLLKQIKIEKSKSFMYTVKAVMEENYKTVNPINSFKIRRPAESVTFVVIIHQKIHFKGYVEAIAQEEYGEENPICNMIAEIEKDGEYFKYIYCFTDPKLFCEYGIKWKWDD